MPGIANHYRNPCVVRIPLKRNKTIKRKKVENETRPITPTEISQFETYYEIKSAQPLIKLNSCEETMLHEQPYIPRATTIIVPPTENIYSEKSVECFMSTNSQVQTNRWSLHNVATACESDDYDLSQRMDWNKYHRLGVIHQWMEDLEEEFPSLCTTAVIGKSLEGRDLKILKISNSNAANTSVWIDAGIHAREWIAPAVNTFVANHIVRNFDALSESVTNKDWYFLPVVNPDGYEYTHTTNRMWRKNKAYVNKELYGVDLNRNFSFGWGGKGSSSDPKHAFYRGQRPFSEPESAAMKNAIMNSGVRFKVYITLHSFGQVIILPFAYSETLASDYIKLLQGATIMSRAIYATNGNTYKVGVSKDVMYPASGTSNDWSHGVVGIPYCYLIELRSKKHKFKLPEAEIAETGAEIVNCLFALMEFTDRYESPKMLKNPSSNFGSVYANNDDEERGVHIRVNPKKSFEFRNNVRLSLPIPTLTDEIQNK